MIAGSIVLGAFLGLTGYALDQAYQRSAKEAVKERLQGHVMTLVASAQVKLNGMIYIPEFLPIVRFNQINSGLYAIIANNQEEALWRSPSLGNLTFPVMSLSENTESRFSLIKDSLGRPLFNYSYGVSWDSVNKTHVYTINVAESLDNYRQEIDRFRQLLWMWLGGASLLLLTVQGLILRWSLRPLRKAAEEIALIEQGKQERIKGFYPKELTALTKNLNALIASNRVHLQRHRNALSDLAHSLKTPLALMRSASESRQADMPLESVVAEQVDQMQKIVDYQLQRAATAGRVPLSKPVPVAPITQKIANSLVKVYAEKPVKVAIDVEENILFYGDESDLYELLGNVLDNAFKWCKSRVDIGITSNTTGKEAAKGLQITVDDDGPGVDPQLADEIVKRGVSSDKNGGSGIGLAIVRDILQAYEGQLRIEKSPLGGARFVLLLTANTNS